MTISINIPDVPQSQDYVLYEILLAIKIKVEYMSDLIDDLAERVETLEAAP